MKKLIWISAGSVWVCVIHFMGRTSTASWSVERSAEARASQTSEEGDAGLKCSIAVQTPEWERQASATVSVVLENDSSIALDVSVVPAFVLRPEIPNEEPLRTELSYMTIWDLAKGSLRVSSSVGLRVDSRSSWKKTVDVSKLLWSRINSPLLPHSDLYEAVPPGKYSLHLKVRSVDGEIQCSSNAVDIVLK